MTHLDISFGYGSLTLFGRLFQYRSPHSYHQCGRSETLPRQTYNPHAAAVSASYAVMGLGSSRFARRYYGNLLFSSGYVRCFSSPGSLRCSRQSVICLQMGLPHSDSLGSLVASTSPRHFAAWPRPSSAGSAKASTMCSSLTMSPVVTQCLYRVCYGARGDTSVSSTLAGQVNPLSLVKVQKPTSGWSRGDSNPGPPPCKGGALPTKLRPPVAITNHTPKGWARLDSNQGPRPYQGRALTT